MSEVEGNQPIAKQPANHAPQGLGLIKGSEKSNSQPSLGATVIGKTNLVGNVTNAQTNTTTNNVQQKSYVQAQPAGQNPINSAQELRTTNPVDTITSGRQVAPVVNVSHQSTVLAAQNQVSQSAHTTTSTNNRNFHLKAQTTGLIYGTERKPDFFGKHNEELAEKAANKKKRRKILIKIGVVLGIILTVALVGWFLYWLLFQVIFRPDITQSSGDSANTPIAIVEARKIYDNDSGNRQKVDEYFNKNINSARSEYEKNQLVLLQIEFAANYPTDEYPNAVVEAAKKANVETMSEEQISVYCGQLFNAYKSLEDTENAEYWYDYGQEHGVPAVDYNNEEEENYEDHE